ncbi:MAG TPA: Rv3654c family TadE-like protein [Actinomycetota bacterium]|nr:Rv3654c family TadE-like protein [Actinomycetota bacterium]
MSGGPKPAAWTRGLPGARPGTGPRPGERGSVTVLAAALLLLAGVLALASVDLMRALQARARAQTAADAAALAAAQELAVPSGRSPAEAAAEYALRNGGTLRSCRCELGTWEAVVEVAVEMPLSFVGPPREILGRARAVVAAQEPGPGAG